MKTNTRQQDEEKWKPVVGYEGFYEVSSLGGVRSLNKINKCKKSPPIKKGRNMRSYINPYGYVRTTLCKNGVAKKFKVHSLVARAFIPNPLNKPCVRHKNGKKADNKATNLEWGTHAESMLHAAKLGLFASGEKHGQSGREKDEARREIGLGKNE